jgi:2-polyprenyl-3-methyl-5-hydroxy-6-metoxy-1,4-benzoquinol methylase
MMNIEKETANTWNKIAHWYQEKFMDLELYNDSYDYFCNNLAHGATVLDAGCGPGNISSYLLKKRSDLSLTGIDYAENMIELARKNNPGARYFKLDVRNANRLDQKFDGIICGFCLPYLNEPDAEKFIDDCFNLLNVNGCFYLSFVPGDPALSGVQQNSRGDRSAFFYHDRSKLLKKFELLCPGQVREFNYLYERSDVNIETHTVLVTGNSPDDE